MLITDIYWERIYLHIILDGENTENFQFILSGKDNGKSCPLHFEREKGEIVINITNTGKGEPFPSGEWFILFGKDGKWEKLCIEKRLFKKFQTLDKVYWYGQGSKACVFSIVPYFEEDIESCFIRSVFMKEDSKPQSRYIPDKKASLKRKLHTLTGNFVGRCLNLLYGFLSLFTAKKGNRILLMSENRAMGGNLKALDERLKERGLDKEFQISYHFSKALNTTGIKLFLQWFRLVFLCAKQDCIFIDDYEPFFEHVNLCKKTRLIQVWHAGVGFKSVGYARFGQEGSCHPFVSSNRKYDYAVVGSEGLKKVYSEVFGIDEEKCLPFGLMRNDGYTDAEKISAFKSEFYEKYPQLKDKKIILFAPTFRGDSVRTAYYPYDVLNQKEIYDLCGEDKVFLIKMHPFIREKMKIKEEYQSRIIDFSDYPDINSLFYVTDLLITDYSSSIYEFAMLSKPMLFFAFDKETYESKRSLHRTLEEFAPGKVCLSFEEMTAAIRAGDYETEKLQKFREENFTHSEGLASDRVIDFILLNKR